MDKQLLDQLLAESFTKSQLLRKIREVEQYLNQKLFGGENLVSKGNALRGYLDKITAQEFPDLIEKLKKSVDDLPTAIITTAVPLPDETIQKLCLKLRGPVIPTAVEGSIATDSSTPLRSARNDGVNNLIIDTKVNPEILAGATVIYKGVVHDYSLSKKITDQKEAILNSFKGYFK